MQKFPAFRLFYFVFQPYIQENIVWYSVEEYFIIKAFNSDMYSFVTFPRTIAVEKVFCALELNKTHSVTVVQQNFRMHFGQSPSIQLSIHLVGTEI